MNIKDEEIINIISNAALNKKVVEISYRDSKGFVTNRETEPYEIRESDNVYYGFCITKDAIRQFKIPNIMSATITNKEYKPKWPIKIQGKDKWTVKVEK